MKKTTAPRKAAPKRRPRTPRTPAASPRETILLAVTGMSPAILTETLWALAHPEDEAAPMLPHRVVCVTTSEGRKKLGELFEPAPALGSSSPWEALRGDLEAKGHDLTGRLRFGQTADDIRVITSADPATGRSQELPDIRNRQENEAAADFLLEQVRGIVENPDTELIASVAGGRKTMSALLYACMTLLGRETDRITHVLVNEPFETLRGFWFPGQPGGSVTDRDGRAHDPLDARVELAEVPFVPLRNLFRRELGRSAGGFGRLIAECRAGIRSRAGERLRLMISSRNNAASVNGVDLSLSPREHLVLLFFARRAKNREIILCAYDEALVDLNDTRKALRNSAPADDWHDWRHSNALGREFDERELTRVLSDLRSKTRHTGLADVLPQKGRCSLDIPPKNISITD
ncbi:MAG: CRISPR-associated ring nuclease Csm6 [Terrimicrobiaceae bacterium]|nr:CRISPR-associated ring nuclease Csm6 [Terrimicrobiaceae bacterium]